MASSEYLPNIPKTELLKDKVAIVTGASRGIGRAIAETFAYHGARAVVINSTERSQLQAEETIAAIQSHGAEALWVPGSIAEEDTSKNLIQQTLDQFKGFQVLVNNAGMTRDNLFLRLGIQDFDDVMNVNSRGAVLTTKAALRHLSRQDDASVIFTSSISAHGNAGQSNYAASKGAMESFMRSMAAEYGKRGLRFNAVAPALVDTAIISPLTQEQKDALVAQTPLGRIITPAEVGGVALFLASGMSRVVNGQVLNADGGMIR